MFTMLPLIAHIVGRMNQMWGIYFVLRTCKVCWDLVEDQLQGLLHLTKTITSGILDLYS